MNATKEENDPISIIPGFKYVFNLWFMQFDFYLVFNYVFICNYFLV